MTDLQEIVQAHGAEAALELLLLRQHVHGLASVPESEAFLAAHPVQPRLLASRLTTHALGGLLWPLLPPGLAQHPDMIPLIDHAERRSRYNLLLLSEMLRIQQRCRRGGLDVIFVKGPLLSHILYGNYTRRSASDLDILLRMEDFARVREMLLEDGYQELYPFPENERNYFLQYQREAAFMKTTSPGVHLHIELQWSVLPTYYRMPYGNDYFFQHSVETRIGQISVNTLDHTQHLLLLLAHHGMGDLWRNLRHLLDIVLFVQRKGHEVNWREIDVRTTQWGMQTAMHCGFAMANQLLNVPFPQIETTAPPRLVQYCVKNILRVPMLPKRRTHRDTLMHQLRLCDSSGDRRTLIAGLLKRYSSPGMDELSLVKLPRILFPVYLVIRQFRFLYKGRIVAAAKPR